MRRLGRLIGAVVVCAAALGPMAATVTSSSAEAADWQLQTQVDGEGYRPHLPILGISCPSTKLCVAVGELDHIVSSTNPTGGTSAWHQAQPVGEAETDCHAHWVPPCRDPTNRTLRSVSCPSVGLCFAVTGEGYVYSSTNPTGSGDDWRVADVDGTDRDTHLFSVSCPTTSLCVAVSGERYTAGKILTSTDPTGGAAAWNVAQLDETLDFRGVSCGTPTLCVATAQQGRLLVSTDPTGGPAAWTELGTPGGPGDLQGVSCAATVLCVTGNAGGNILSSTNPTSLSSWREADGGPSVQVTGVSCLPTRQCVAVDNNGDVLISNDPTRGRSSWSQTQLIPYVQPPSELDQPLNALFGVSCVSVSFCALVGADGQIFTSTDPFAVTSEAPSKPGRGTKRGPKRPKTTIARLKFPSKRALREHRARVMARFFAKGRVRRFECQVRALGDTKLKSAKGRGYRSCHSPWRFRIAKGTYSLRVRAVGATGLRGPAAVKRFYIDKSCFPEKNLFCLGGSGEFSP